MTTTNLQRASARVALKKLELEPTFSFKVAVLKRFLDTTALTDLKKVEEEARAFNDDIGSLGYQLSPDAAAYWDAVQTQLRKGKTAQAKADRTAERAVSLACERLAEDFENQVPDYDQPKFKRFDPQDHEGTWDDEWSFVEHEPPLLRDEYVGTKRIGNVKNHAQQVVIGSMVSAHLALNDEERETAKARTLEMYRLARAENAVEQVEENNRQQRDARRDALAGMDKEGKAGFLKRERELKAEITGDRSPLTQVKYDDLDTGE